VPSDVLEEEAGFIGGGEEHQRNEKKENGLHRFQGGASQPKPGPHIPLPAE